MQTALLRLWTIAACTCAASALSGCAALSPLDGIPANYFPRELHGETRSGKRTIDLSLLRQTPADEYRLECGDVLSVFIHGVLGSREQMPPVYFPKDSEDTPPSFGYPVHVRSDGTVRLPLGEPVVVRGLTVPLAEDAIREMLFKSKVLNKDNESAPTILISLQRKRRHTVLVIRQEQTMMANSSGGPGQLQMGSAKRGMGKIVKLEAGNNDVLNAITETGGLPGLDAENIIYVIRQKRTRQNQANPVGPPVEEMPAPPGQPSRAGVTPALFETAAGHSAPGSASAAVILQSDRIYQNDPVGHSTALPPALTAPQTGYPTGNGTIGGPQLSHGHAPWPVFQNGEISDAESFLAQRQLDSEILTIPVRLGPGEFPQFAEADIILHDGDIVFIESRETEVFYTGGLLPGNQFALPRDYDVDVVRAIAIASGQGAGGGGTGFGAHYGGVSALNRDISVSASDVIVLRQLPDGNQVPIKVDLYKALKNPKRYSVRILPGDYVILQYKPHEAVFAFIERNLLAGGLIGIAATNVTGGSSGSGK